MRWQTKKKKILKDLADILYSGPRDYSALVACVKIYNFGGWDHEIPESLDGIVGEDDFDKDNDWSSVVEEDYWYMVENNPESLFYRHPRPINNFTLVPEGRSNGWLCVSEWNSGSYAIGLREDKIDILKAAKDLPREYLEEFYEDVMAFSCNEEWIERDAHAFYTEEINRYRKQWLNDVAEEHGIEQPFPEVE